MNPVEEFFQAAVEQVEAWLQRHYDRYEWARDHTDEDYVYTYFEQSPQLSNAYYFFDWEDAAYRRMSKQYTWRRCPECGLVSEYSCPDHEADQEELPAEEVHDFLYETGYQLDSLTLWQTLVFEGFDTFAKGVHSYTDAFKDEAVACLRAVANAESDELIAHCLWMLKLQHTSGLIVAKDPRIDAVRTHGLSALFSRDEVEDFIEHGCLTVAEHTLEAIAEAA